jgi:hypothetical protein
MACGARRRRADRLTGTAAVVAVVLGLAGCGASEQPASSPVPSPGAGPWDQRDLAVYREAVRRLEDYDTAHQRFLAAGRATPAARAFYQRHLRDWQPAFAELARHEREHLRVARAPVVLGTEPASIQAFQDGAAHVVLRRCTDQSDLGTTRDGVPVPAAHEEPVLQEAEVRRYENLTWRIVSVTTTDRPCDR